jgi:hypothetical protein
MRDLDPYRRLLKMLVDNLADLHETS